MGANSVEFELVDDELRPEDFREAIGRIRRLFTLRINIPYNLIAALLATYFGALLLRVPLIEPVEIPFIGADFYFIALSFFLFFLLLAFLTMSQTGIDLFHGPTRFFLVRIVSSVVLYILVIGSLLLVWRLIAGPLLTYFMIIIVSFWFLFQISFLFRGCKSMAFKLHHRRSSRFIALLVFLVAIITTVIVWLYSNNLIGRWVQNQLGLSLPRIPIQIFGERMNVTLASGAVLLIFSVFTIFSFLRRRLLEFLIFWFYLLYHYGLLAMNLAKNMDPTKVFTVSPASGINLELPTRVIDLILMVVTIIWVVHSLAHQAATANIATRWRWINDFSMTHFFFSMAIVYLAGLFFFNTVEIGIPGLEHASLKLIQAGIHGVMLAFGLLFVTGETLLWLVSLPFRLLYWLLTHPWVLLILAILGVIITMV